MTSTRDARNQASGELARGEEVLAAKFLTITRRNRAATRLKRERERERERERDRYTYISRKTRKEIWSIRKMKSRHETPASRLLLLPSLRRCNVSHGGEIRCYDALINRFWFMALCTRKGIDFLWKLLTLESSGSVSLSLSLTCLWELKRSSSDYLQKWRISNFQVRSLQARFPCTLILYNQWSVIPDFQNFLSSRFGEETAG